MSAKTALCFIAWNEREGCEHDLPRFDFSGFHEVFAIDGGSADGTVEVLRRHGVRVYAQNRPSLNAAYWQAVEATNCDNIVVFFPKGTLDPAIAHEMRLLLLQQNDFVIPSRLIEGGRNEEDDRVFRPRKWGIETLALIAASLWRQHGPMIWDVLHGVKGFTRKAFLEMRPARTGVSIDLEMVVRSYRLGLRCREFPVVESARKWGGTQFKILPTGLKLAAYLLRELCSTRPTRDTPRPDCSDAKSLAITPE